MQVSFYGRLGELIGRKIDHPSVPTVAQLRTSLATSFPDAADLLLGDKIKIAIDDRLVAHDSILSGSEQVDFFPPLSGG
ncbi:MAG: MoaD/ThiS family protein [Sphingomicrobium sp.]